MVGVGAQGGLNDANAFLAATGIQTPLMLFDEQYGLWNHYGVTGQPTAILVNSGGTAIHEFDGRFDGAEVLQVAGSS